MIAATKTDEWNIKLSGSFSNGRVLDETAYVKLLKSGDMLYKNVGMIANSERQEIREAIWDLI